MTDNTGRAIFAQKAYRYLEVKDDAVKQRFDGAQSVEISTNLLSSAANTVATKLFEETKKAAQVYTIQVEGVYTIDDWADGTMRFIVNDPAFNLSGSVMRLIAMNANPNTNTTVLTVRG